MSTLEKAQLNSDYSIKYHFKQYLETINAILLLKCKVFAAQCIHLARLLANRISLWFFFSFAFSLLAWVSCKSAELPLLFCFVSGSGICLCFIFPYLLIKRVNQSACERIDCVVRMRDCVAKKLRPVMLSLSRTGSHQKAHGVPWRSWSSTTKADFSLWIRQTTQKATIASINTI